MTISAVSHSGWVTNTWRVYFQHRLSNNDLEAIRSWCRENCVGTWRVKPQHVRFHNEDDSLLFRISFT